ncbi:HypC/HybG/HupF family hydrogenase formation chaperone [Candidatus Cloacimonadota bacterium]
MCLAIPGKLVEKVNDEKGLVDLGGVKKEIALNFIPEVKIGEWILIHTGFGLEIISEEDALETIDLLQQAYGLNDDGS